MHLVHFLKLLLDTLGKKNTLLLETAQLNILHVLAEEIKRQVRVNLFTQTTDGSLLFLFQRSTNLSFSTIEMHTI